MMCSSVLAVQVRGFSALQIGETVFVVGVAQLVLSPFSAYIARAIDLRLMLAIGLGLLASFYLIGREPVGSIYAAEAERM